jgi:hypothetical protein
VAADLDPGARQFDFWLGDWDLAWEGLEWDWQLSEDAGATWQTGWQVRYTRRSGS